MKKILIIFVLIGFSFSLFSSAYGEHLVGIYLAPTVPGGKIVKTITCMYMDDGIAKVWYTFSGQKSSWVFPQIAHCGIVSQSNPGETTFTVNVPLNTPPGEYQFSSHANCESYTEQFECVIGLDTIDFWNVVVEEKTKPPIFFEPKAPPNTV